MIQETTKKIVLIKQRIQAAQDRQKIYADLNEIQWSLKLGIELCSRSHLGKGLYDSEIKRLKQSHISLVKVCWNSRRGLEFTWEGEDSFKQKYPQLFTKRASSSTTRTSALRKKLF
nr:putative reverse transcriptase domain-containing protein [Tanacetum cinerariifolium]